MANRIALQSGTGVTTLQSGGGSLLLQSDPGTAPPSIPFRMAAFTVAAALAFSAFPAFQSYAYTEPPANPSIPLRTVTVVAPIQTAPTVAKYHSFPFQPAVVASTPAPIPMRRVVPSAPASEERPIPSSVGRVPLYVPDFPTTGILDEFTRANEDPLANSTWAARQSGFDALRVISSAIRANATSGVGSSYWSERTFGPACEIYATISGPPANGYALELYLRLQGAGGAFVDQTGYVVLFVGVNPATDLQCIVRRLDNGSSVTIFDQQVIVTNFAAGDAVGASLVGPVLRVWHRPSGGTWSLRAQVTDETYSAAGSLAVEIADSIGSPTIIADDVGGGTVSALDGKPVVPPRHGRELTLHPRPLVAPAFQPFPFQPATVAPANAVVPYVITDHVRPEPVADIRAQYLPIPTFVPTLTQNQVLEPKRWALPDDAPRQPIASSFFGTLPANATPPAAANPVLAIQNRLLGELREVQFGRFPTFTSYVYNEETPPSPNPANPVPAYRQQPTTLRPATWHVPAQYLPFPFYTQNPIIHPKLWKVADREPERLITGGYAALVPFTTTPPPTANPVIPILKGQWISDAVESKLVGPAYFQTVPYQAPAPANPVLPYVRGQWVGDAIAPLVGIHGYLPFPWVSVAPVIPHLDRLFIDVETGVHYWRLNATTPFIVRVT